MQEGRRFLRNGPLKSVLGKFSAIVGLAPDFAEGWHKRVEIHYRMGNFQDSIKDLEMTVSLEPRHYGALAALGLIYLNQGDERAALEELEEALRVNPHLPGTRSKIEELKEKLDGKKI